MPSRRTYARTLFASAPIVAWPPRFLDELDPARRAWFVQCAQVLVQRDAAVTQTPETGVVR